MCGIVGYVGGKQAAPLLLEGLRRLEYRGYDSAGIAVGGTGSIVVEKRTGRVQELSASLASHMPSGTFGIGHTRWATHGEPNNVNAHPHLDCTSELAVVHNGVIENYTSLKAVLQTKGHQFRSSTDTEVLSHLIEDLLKGSNSLVQAVLGALQEVQGTYGLVVLSARHPNELVVARRGSPLVIGYGEGETFVASDASAVVEHTRNVTYLEDGEVAVITPEQVQTRTLDDRAVLKQVEEISLDLQQVEKGGYPHFMLKEIHEQPVSIANALRGRIRDAGATVTLGGLVNVLPDFERFHRLILLGCGTSWHAALVGRYMLEQYARIVVEVEYASEFRYRDPVVGGEDAVVAISQSGETADTLAALREAKTRGSHIYGICNVVGSAIARETEAGIYIHAGPEIGVASTKAFTSQLTVLALLTLVLGRSRGLQDTVASEIAAALKRIPGQVQSILDRSGDIAAIAEELKNVRNVLYLGRGYNFPAALEGALKLKEISYIHAEGYPAAEMKHGPIALIDENMPVIFVAPRDGTYEKILSNVQEVKARRGRVIAVVNEAEERIRRLADHLVVVPPTLDLLSPILDIIPLQLLAYHVAVLRGCSVDQPRNLAKSVTVE